VDRGEIKVSREDFETFWTRFVAERRAYMTSGSHLDLTTRGRKRLVPFFGAVPLSKIDEDWVREWLDTMIELVEAGDLAPKTVNNARTCLSSALKEAVRRDLIARNPCEHVAALPLERTEIEYLRLAEIEPYIDACAYYYVSLGAFLIGTGARVSEAGMTNVSSSLSCRMRVGRSAVEVAANVPRPATRTQTQLEPLGVLGVSSDVGHRREHEPERVRTFRRASAFVRPVVMVPGTAGMVAWTRPTSTFS
jgi:hypothetical protein